MTQQQLEGVIERLRNPAPGSRIEAAKKYGIDLTLLVQNLRRTPAERADHMMELVAIAKELRGTARRR